MSDTPLPEQTGDSVKGRNNHRRLLRRTIRLAFRFVAFLISLVALLMVLFFLLIHTDPVQTFVRDMVNITVRDSIGLQATYERFTISLFPPRAVIQGVEIEGKESGEEETNPFVTIGAISASLDGSMLLEGKINIIGVVVEEPKVRLVLGQGGEIINLPSLTSSDSSDDNEGEEGGTELRLQAIRLVGGEVYLEADELIPGAPLTVELREIGVSLDETGDGEYDIALNVNEGFLLLGEHRHSLRALAAAARLKAEGIIVEEAILELETLTLELGEGSVALAAPFDIELSAEAHAPMSTLERLPWGAPGLGGELSAEARLQIHEGDLEIHGGLHLKDLVYSLSKGSKARDQDDDEAAALDEESERLGNLELAAHLVENVVSLSSARFIQAHNDGGQLRIEEARLNLDETALPIEAKVELETIEMGPLLAALGLSDPGVDLDLHGELEVAGSLNPLGLAVKMQPVEVRNLVLTSNPNQGLRRGRLEGSVEIGSSAARTSGLRVSFGQEAELHDALVIIGEFPFGGDSDVRGQLKSSPQGIPLSELAGLAGLELDGQAGLEANVSGTYSDLLATISLDVTALNVMGYGIDHISGDLRYRDNTVEVPELQATIGNSHVGLHDGRIHLGGTDGIVATSTIELDPVNLGDMATLLDIDELGPLRGALKGQAQLRFRKNMAGLQVELEGSIPDLAWGEDELGDIELAVDVEGRNISARQVRLIQTDGGHLDLVGTVGGDGALDMSLEVVELSLPPLEGLIPSSLELGTTINARATITGTTDSPRGRGELSLSETTLSDLAFDPSTLSFQLTEDGLHLSGRVAGEVLQIEDLLLALSSPYEFSVHGVLEIDDLNNVVPEEMLPDGVGGSLTASLEALGNLDDLETTEGAVVISELQGRGSGFVAVCQRPLTLVIDNGAIHGEGATFTVDADEPALEPESSGSVSGATVRIAGLRLGLASPWPLVARSVIRLEDLGRLLGRDRAPEGLRAGAEILLGASANLADVDTLRGVATVKHLEARQGDLRLNAPNPLALTFTTNRVELEPVVLEVEAADVSRPYPLSLGGWITPTAMDFAIDGHLELGLFTSLIDPVESLAGSVDLTCRIGGSPRDLQLLGRADIAINRVEVEGVPGAITDGGGVIRLSESTILIDDLQASLLGGRARVGGRIVLDDLGLESYRIDVDLRDATYPIGPQSTIVLDGDIAVDSPTEEEELPLISGDIIITRLRYVDPLDIHLDVGEVANRVRYRRASTRSFDPDAAAIRLDIGVTDRGNTLVDNDLMEGRVHIVEGSERFRVVGTNQSVGLLGLASVERGTTVTFRNTAFAVNRGLLHFISRDQIDATVDFEATAQRRDWLITLRVTGTMNEPEILLSSEPQLNELDIVMLLTVGMIRSEAEQLNAGAVLADVLSQGLVNSIEETIPFIDEIQVTTDYSSHHGYAVPQVRISRHLTDRLELGAMTDVSSNRTFEGVLELELREGTSIEGAYTREPGERSLGNVGVDLIQRWEF